MTDSYEKAKQAAFKKLDGSFPPRDSVREGAFHAGYDAGVTWAVAQLRKSQAESGRFIAGILKTEADILEDEAKSDDRGRKGRQQ